MGKTPLGIMSHWSLPGSSGRGIGWYSKKHMLMAWALSSSLLKEHCDSTLLVTDANGYQTLINELGLQFDKVEVCLDEKLKNVDPGLWAMGKLVAYGMADRPFVHVDSDVFLLHDIPDRLKIAPVFGQNAEKIYRKDMFTTCYRSDLLQEFIPKRPAFIDDVLKRDIQLAICTGLVGGNDIDLFRQYSEDALNMASDPINAPGWKRFFSKTKSHFQPIIVLEQWFLMASLINKKTWAEYLYGDWPCFKRGFEETSGYVHLWGELKLNEQVCKGIEKILKTRNLGLYRAAEDCAYC